MRIMGANFLCSNSLDKVGKKTTTQSKHIYVYKETTRIPPLFYIDDLFGVSNSGIEAIKMNNFCCKFTLQVYSVLHYL